MDTYEVFEHIGEKRTLLNNLTGNYLLHHAIVGQMTEVKGVGRKITQFLDDLRNRKRNGS